MTIKSKMSFNPKVLLSTPRRSPGVPNSKANRILFVQSSYNFEEHQEISGISFINAENNSQTLVSLEKKVSNPVWIDDSTIAFLRGVPENGKTEVVVGKVEDDVVNEISKNDR